MGVLIYGRFGSIEMFRLRGAGLLGRWYGIWGFFGGGMVG